MQANLRTEQWLPASRTLLWNKIQHKGEPLGFTSGVAPCHRWHKPLFFCFHCISFKFPFCVWEMNIWSSPPEPVTDGPLKLRDTALCLWHCGIYSRKRSNFSAEQEEQWKVNRPAGWFTCLESLLFPRVGPQMFGGHSPAQCLLFWKRPSALMFFVCVYFEGTAAVCRKTFSLRLYLYCSHVSFLSFFVFLFRTSHTQANSGVLQENKETVLNHITVNTFLIVLENRKKKLI